MEPHAQALRRLLPEKVAGGCHRHGLDHIQGRLAEAARGNRGRDHAALIVPAIEPLAGREARLAARLDRTYRDQVRGCRGRSRRSARRARLVGSFPVSAPPAFETAAIDEGLAPLAQALLKEPAQVVW